jgi:cytidylate kinase
VAEREERAPSFVERLARILAAAMPEFVPPPEGTVPDLDETRLVRITEGVVAEMAMRGRVVLVGRAAPAVLGRRENALHVKLVAPRTFRIQAAVDRLGIDPDEAARLVDQTDAMRARYHREYYHRDWADPLNYHMVLNTGWLGLGGATEVIVRSVGRQEYPNPPLP